MNSLHTDEYKSSSDLFKPNSNINPAVSGPFSPYNKSNMSNQVCNWNLNTIPVWYRLCHGFYTLTSVLSPTKWEHKTLGIVRLTQVYIYM